MANIQPISVWYQGDTHEVNVLNAVSKNDNLIDSAVIQYQLVEFIIDPIDPSNQFSQVLIIGELTIDGQDYIDWDSSVSANDWIYNWVAQQLNLTIIP